MGQSHSPCADKCLGAPGKTKDGTVSLIFDRPTDVKHTHTCYLEKDPDGPLLHCGGGRWAS